MMNYKSTRSETNDQLLTSSQAILQGLSHDGGLYIPESIPKLSLETIGAMVEDNYQTKAKKIFSNFLTDFSSDEINQCVDAAYNIKSFNTEAVTPLVHLKDNEYVLELFHGPTCAFKDVALQILPHFLTTSAQKNGDNRTYVILVATSGDTGKAALEGFKDVPRTKVLVFYPDQGVSHIQKLQMATQNGNNVQVLAVKGNFDDTQTGVKTLFSDKDLNQSLENHHLTFSSANSINWGRLVPQIVYYFESYLELLKEGKIKLGDAINFSVPTGNFGNILAGYFAKKMGLPIKKLICASNSNNVLNEFIRTGTYDRNRPFHKTMSPSMDILISSNLERLLYILSNGDGPLINQLMNELKCNGTYTVSDSLLTKIQEDFWSGECNEEETIQTIQKAFNEQSYLMDTHTAVAEKVHQDYLKTTGDTTPCVIVSTASPYKFNSSVAKGIMDNSWEYDEITLLEKVHELTGLPIPESLNHLDQKPLRFTEVIEKESMIDGVKNFLNI